MGFWGILIIKGGVEERMLIKKKKISVYRGCRVRFIREIGRGYLRKKGSVSV